jgi:hypothetical protein
MECQKHLHQNVLTFTQPPLLLLEVTDRYFCTNTYGGSGLVHTEQLLLRPRDRKVLEIRNTNYVIAFRKVLVQEAALT